MDGSARRERGEVGCDRVVTRWVEVVGWCPGHGRLESETAAVGPGGVRWVPGGDSGVGASSYPSCCCDTANAAGDACSSP